MKSKDPIEDLKPAHWGGQGDSHSASMNQINVVSDIQNMADLPASSLISVPGCGLK